MAIKELMVTASGMPSVISAIGMIAILANIKAAAEKEIRLTLGHSRVIIDPI